MQSIQEAREEFEAARANLASTIVTFCPDWHHYVQHRDEIPPWCPNCGMTEAGYHKDEFARKGA